MREKMCFSSLLIYPHLSSCTSSASAAASFAAAAATTS